MIIDASVTPSIYWKHYLIGTHNMLAKIAVRLLSVPCSSASVERQFSITSKTHTTSRSQLCEVTIRQAMLIKWHQTLVKDELPIVKAKKQRDDQKEVQESEELNQSPSDAADIDAVILYYSQEE